MWGLIRIVILTLALAGFVGQATANATSFPMDAVAADMSDMADCAHMTAGHGDEFLVSHQLPCKDMMPGCIARAGCVALFPALPTGVALAPLPALTAPIYHVATGRLAGIVTAPPRTPPKTEA
ncbi:hypothetical protein [Brevundimonas sp.]|uniref:hypothetical protein n=1 Tax=Brevundimonas sp. TaxID=1871086 RepID=UPI003A8D4716